MLVRYAFWCRYCSMSFQSFGRIASFSDSFTPGLIQIFESKIQDFFQTFFSKQWFLFPDTRLSNRWSKETLKNLGSKGFLQDALQTYGRDWIRFDQNEKKKFTYQELVASFEKKIFQTSSPLSKLFYRSGKLLSKFQDFFLKNLRLCTYPSTRNTKTVLERNFALTVRTCMTVSRSFARMTFLWNVSACATILAGDLSHVALVKAS